MRTIVLIAHNLRSTHNVGSLLRTAEGLGITKVYFTGYTPYPQLPNDSRLPHISAKLTRQIHKTALGAEVTQAWEHIEDVVDLIRTLEADGFSVCALEQTDRARSLRSFTPGQKTAVVVGNELHGLDATTLSLCKTHLMIPMKGKKESFNVVQAAAMCLYQLTAED